MTQDETPERFTYDKILKSILSDALVIELLLRRYVCSPGCADVFDYSTLQQLPTEHIDPSTANTFTAI